MQRPWLNIASGVLLTLGVLGLLVLTGAIGSDADATSAIQRGEWIFQSATDSENLPIPYEGGFPERMACADCHGADGRGKRTATFTAPDITYRNLTDHQGILRPDGTRGPRYNEHVLKRAITQGIDPRGRPLEWPMPHWQLPPDALDDLVAYLKTLE